MELRFVFVFDVIIMSVVARVVVMVLHPGQRKDSLVHAALGHPCRACLQGLQGP